MGKVVLAPAVLEHLGALLGTLAFQLAEQGGGLCGLEAALLARLRGAASASSQMQRAEPEPQK